MKPEEMSSFSREDLINCGKGLVFPEKFPRLPIPPMLMMDRIVEINKEGGKYESGFILAEKDIAPEDWYFDCHFIGDPVMPGCLGLDAMWQLLGFYLGWLGVRGRGRALGVDSIKFRGSVEPTEKLITYKIHLKKVMRGKLNMGVADGELYLNDKIIYTCNGLRTGVFE